MIFGEYLPKRGFVKSPLSIFWNRFSRNKAAMAGLLIFLIMVVVAIFAPLLAPYDPSMQFDDKLLVPPSWRAQGSPEYLFGTDDLGRDLLSRLIMGAQLTLGLAFAIVAIALIIGVLLGALAGFLGRTVESIILRLMDILLALPSLLLALAIVAILGPGLPNAIYAVAIVLIPHFVRITRASIKQELSQDYVRAARLDGAGPYRLFVHVILPNISAPLIVQTSLSFSTAVLELAALGFLGFGAQAPTPEWGTILSESRVYIQIAPWTVALPGFAILLTVLSVNLLGDGIREALDPRINR